MKSIKSIWYGVSLVLATVLLLAIIFYSTMSECGHLLGKTCWQATTQFDDANSRSISHDPSATLRNLGLVVVSIAALLLGVWRSVVADRQSDIAKKQLELANNGFAADRFQKAVELLIDNKEVAHTPGLRTLENLALNDQENYARPCFDTVVAFIKKWCEEDHKLNTLKRTSQKNRVGRRKLPRWVEEALSVLESMRSSTQTISWPRGRTSEIGFVHLDEYDFSRRVFHMISLKSAMMNYIRLDGGNVIDSYVKSSHLKGSSFLKCKIESSDFVDCDLSGADFTQCEFLECKMFGSNISNAQFHEAQFGVQDTLHGAWAWSDRPPQGLPENLNVNLRDPKTYHRQSYERQKTLGDPEFSNE